MPKWANGEGSKPRKKSNGRYEARATLDTPTGRKRVSFYGATAKEAADKRTAAIADRNRGALFLDPGRLTVVEYLERWLTDTARYQVAPSTHGRYQRSCRNHLIPFFGRIKLRDLSPPHIRAFKAQTIEGGLNTVGVMQGVISAALNQAVDEGLIFQNPASRVKKAATRGETPMRSNWFSGGGFQAPTRRHGHPRRGSDNPRPSYRDAQGELAALRWENLDLGVKPNITVRRSADTRTRTVVSTTKTGKERRVGIGPRTVETLEAHRGRQRLERMAAHSWDDPGLVFPNTKGKIRRRDSVVCSLKALLEEAGLPTDVRFHDLRHTAGTLALRQGVPLHTVSRMLGHSDPAMTLRRYAHVLDDMRDDAGRAMNDLF